MQCTKMPEHAFSLEFSWFLKRLSRSQFNPKAMMIWNDHGMMLKISFTDQYCVAFRSSLDSVRVLHRRVTLPAFYPAQQKRCIPPSATSDQDLAAIVQVPLTRLTCFGFFEGGKRVW